MSWLKPKSPPDDWPAHLLVPKLRSQGLLFKKTVSLCITSRVKEGDISPAFIAFP